MGIKPEELVASLLREPLLAYRVSQLLAETGLVGPWEQASGIENSYQRTYCRRHVSGHLVGVVARTPTAAVWWTMDTSPVYAGSVPAARAEVDRVLREEGWVLSTRGYASPWQGEAVLFRKSKEGIRLARVWGTTSGKYEIFSFAFSDYTTSLIRDTPTLKEAQQAADQILIEQGWTLS